MGEARKRLEAFLCDGIRVYGGSLDRLLHDLALLAVGNVVLPVKGKK